MIEMATIYTTFDEAMAGHSALCDLIDYFDARNIELDLPLEELARELKDSAEYEGKWSEPFGIELTEAGLKLLKAVLERKGVRTMDPTLEDLFEIDAA
jgi:hypothetical protein